MALYLLLFSCLFFCVNENAGRVWLLGDSIIRWAGDSNQQFPGARVSWLGVSGARICGLPARLNRYLSGRSAPNILVVHLGTNDIFQMSKRQIMQVLSETLTFLRQRLPQVMLVWSEILPHLFWYGEDKRGRGNKVRIDINRHAASLMKSLPGDNRVIYYPAFHNRPYRLFRYEGSPIRNG